MITVSFITLFVNWYNNRLLPLIRQIFLIPYRSNEFVKLKLRLIYDWQVGRPVCLGVSAHFGPVTNFYFSLKFPSDSCMFFYFVSPSLMRGQVCNLLYNCFWALPEQLLLGRSPENSRPYFTVSSKTPPTWRARSPYLYPPRTGWPS
jgi:hypothetical protein